MRGKQSQEKKEKRILLYWNELNRHRINTEGALELISYMFNISERWILELVRTRDFDDYPEVDLTHADLDTELIDSYVEKIHKGAKRSRKQSQKPLTLFD
jgi:hypothetical protein